MIYSKKQHKPLHKHSKDTSFVPPSSARSKQLTHQYNNQIHDKLYNSPVLPAKPPPPSKYINTFANALAHSSSLNKENHPTAKGTDPLKCYQNITPELTYRKKDKKEETNYSTAILTPAKEKSINQRNTKIPIRQRPVSPLSNINAEINSSRQQGQDRIKSSNMNKLNLTPKIEKQSIEKHGKNNEEPRESFNRKMPAGLFYFCQKENVPKSGSLQKQNRERFLEKKVKAGVKQRQEDSNAIYKNELSNNYYAKMADEKWEVMGAVQDWQRTNQLSSHFKEKLLSTGVVNMSNNNFKSNEPNERNQQGRNIEEQRVGKFTINKSSKDSLGREDIQIQISQLKHQIESLLEWMEDCREEGRWGNKHDSSNVKLNKLKATQFLREEEDQFSVMEAYLQRRDRKQQIRMRISLMKERLIIHLDRVTKMTYLCTSCPYELQCIQKDLNWFTRDKIQQLAYDEKIVCREEDALRERIKVPLHTGQTESLQKTISIN